jgi:hypothetical protein
LQDRIVRIDPQFAGQFAQTTKVQHTLGEIIDTRSLSLQISGFAATHAAAVAGAERMGSQPGDLVDSVGEPSRRHIAQARGLVDQFEAPLAEDIRDPLGAVAIIYALLLAPDGSDVRKRQFEVLNESADARVMAEFRRVVPAIDALAAEQRLPLACLALPALHQMSPPQVLDFQNTVKLLVRIDSEVTLFEFAVQRFISKRLANRLREPGEQKVRQRTLSELKDAFAVVLSTLANISGPSNAEAAFAAGLKALQSSAQKSVGSIGILPAGACNVQNLDSALDELESASPAAKKHMLAGFAASIAFDGHMSVREGELLRVIADALGCPVPPIL